MTVTLRPYQVAAATAAWHALTAGQNPVVVMATGTGKSPTFACVARWWVDSCSSDVAVVAHRQELLDQARRHLREAGVPDLRAHVMSVQSLYSEDARPPDGVGLVIYDEAHHAPAPCNLRALAKFDDALVMGLTATPDRSDGKGLGRVFHTVAYRYDAEQAIRDGYLAPPTRVPASSVRELMLLAGRRRTIVFADTVENSRAMARALGTTAAHVDGKTPTRERARIMTAFASGAIQYLCNRDLVTEGFDCLDAETELLTTAGWRGRGQIQAGDMMYSLNRDTGMLEIVPVERYVERPTGPREHMVSIQGQHHNIRVTEGHEFHIKYRRNGQLSDNWLCLDGNEIVQRRSDYALPIAATSAVELPGLPLTDDEIRLIAWFMTDGGFVGSTVSICQSKDYHHEIRALLGRLQLDYRERLRQPGRTNYPNSKPAYEFTIPKGTAHGSRARRGWFKYAQYLDKNVSGALNSMSVAQFDVFWTELLKGDGAKQGNKAGWLWCDRKAQVDAYSAMAVARGRTFSFAPFTTAAGRTVYRISIRNKQWLTSSPTDARAAKIVREPAVPGEVVWCVTNRNSTIVTRRGGKVAIVGNCPATEVAAVFRNVQSRGLLAQMVGRAMRPMPGKRECLLVQLPTARELGLVPPEEVLADGRVRESRAPSHRRASSVPRRATSVEPVADIRPSALGRFWKWVWGVGV